MFIYLIFEIHQDQPTAQENPHLHNPLHILKIPPANMTPSRILLLRVDSTILAN